MKKLILLAGLMLAGMTASAQSVLEMKIQPKLDKHDYAGAEQILNDEINKVNSKWEKAKLKNPAALPDNAKLAEVYNKLGDVFGMQFNPELMLAAQNLPLDTAKFCACLDKTVEYYTKSFVCDNTPDAKGKIKAKHNVQNRKQLMSMLDYYYYSGIFLNQNHDLAGSCGEFMKFIELRKNPAFTASMQDSIYAGRKSLYDQAAFNVALLNYQQQNWDNVLAVMEDALKDEKNLHETYIIKLQAHSAKGDSAAWLATLVDAIDHVENNTNFMEQLIYYYTQKNDAASANAMSDKLIASNPNNKSAWYMKGCTQLNLEMNYPAARECFLKALEVDPNYMEANLNVAYTYMNEVRQNSQNGKYKIATVKSSYDKTEKALYEKEMAEIRDYYQKALPYAEKVRELIPDQPKRWANALSMIYSNLGNKAKADEVDEILRLANNQ